MIELWMPGLLVRDFGLDSKPGFWVVDTRLVGRGSTALIRAPEPAWRRLLFEIKSSEDSLGASTRSAARMAAEKIRYVLDEE